MIEVSEINGRRHYLAPTAIAQITEANPSAAWHGIRAFIRLFDGQNIEARETAVEILRSTLSKAMTAGLKAVEAGAVMHAHPFTWGVAADWLQVKPRTLQSLASRQLIRVDAGATAYWRTVVLTPAGRAALNPTEGDHG